MSIIEKDDSIHIREVWSDNLEEEIAIIREIIDDFNYIAMDTEFPGIVHRPSTFISKTDFNYQSLKENVNAMKLIQLGLTFSDKNGNLPTFGTENYYIWQFNFRDFNLNEDIYNIDSIELLRKCGIDFEKNREKGIDSKLFGELIMSSGVVLNDEVKWVTFHSGLDFGYLLKILTGLPMPETLSRFLDSLKLFFPVVYDIKHLMIFCNTLHGGLSKLAELLGIERFGVGHQAGSDSLLTFRAFWKLKDGFFGGSVEKYGGVLYGLELDVDNIESSKLNRKL